MVRFIYPAAILGVAGLLSCGQDNTPPEVAASVHSLTGPGIPEGMHCLEISVNSGGELSQPARFTVAGLMDRDENGRPESIIGEPTLPDYGTPFELLITARTGINEGCGAAIPNAATYSGSTGPIRLTAGERRVINIALYQVGATETLELGAQLPPRFLHSSTALGDGRVLISGGFDELAPAPCPDGIIADSCFEASASRDAFIFDTPTGEFLPVSGGMLEPRGGHTATLLNDGRVLVAGGATHAILAMSTGEQPVFQILPLGGGFLTAHANFEFFTRGLENPSDDPERAGLPGRGFFEGPSANPAEPGTLNHARFLHAAATVDALRVILAGGMGSGDPANTFEVFNLLRPGGEGISAEDGALRIARTMPSAFVLNESVWIYGGGVAMEDADLAEVWDGVAPVGATESATQRGFELGDAPHPELSLFRPQALPNATGDQALITGWFGPRCDELGDQELPTYAGLDLFQCAEPAGTPSEGTPPRNFFISDTFTPFQPASNQNQAFASAVRLETLDGVVVLGGLKRNFETRAGAVGYLFETEASFGSSCLRVPRALHASTTLPGNRILTTGGLNKIPNSDTLNLSMPGAEIMSLTDDNNLPSITCP